MTTFPTSARALAAVAAIVCAAVATTAPPSVRAQQANPCGPLGALVEPPHPPLTLNDRCDFGTGDPETVAPRDVVGGLARAGLFATIIKCQDENGAETEVAVIARPNELLVTAGTPDGLASGLSLLRERFPNAIGRVRGLNALGAVVRFAPGTINEDFLLRTIPTLQGDGFSVDLNYLEPAQPNNGFRPGDDPVEALDAPPMGRGGEGRVLVVDSPSERGRHPLVEPDVVVSSFGPSTIYDVDGNGFIDEDHSHGVSVASLAKRLAPEADVVLAAVAGQQVRRSGRWTPMMFSDADLIKALDGAFGLSSSGRVTRRTYDVVNLSLGGAGCDGVAARLALGRFMRDLAVIAGSTRQTPPPVYVAAAGNDGGDVAHFPAAFRDIDTMKAAWEAIGDPATVPAAADVRELNAYFLEGMYAVGSWTGGARDSFSNCGDHVNGIAAGAKETVRYPSKSTWAVWSGTSFAAPRVSAALVGASLGDVVLGDAVGAC